MRYYSPSQVYTTHRTIKPSSCWLFTVHLTNTADHFEKIICRVHWPYNQYAFDRSITLDNTMHRLVVSRLRLIPLFIHDIQLWSLVVSDQEYVNVSVGLGSLRYSIRPFLLLHSGCECYLCIEGTFRMWQTLGQILCTLYEILGERSYRLCESLEEGYQQTLQIKIRGKKLAICSMPSTPIGSNVKFKAT